MKSDFISVIELKISSDFELKFEISPPIKKCVSSKYNLRYKYQNFSHTQYHQ